MNFSGSTAPVTHHIPRYIKDIKDTSPEDTKQIIAKYTEALSARAEHHMGYPYNFDFDYKALEGLTSYSINNLGDPFIESNYGVHSRAFEIAVLDWFAGLWEIPREEYWGYITSCGTEGNLYGIYLGRENLPDGVLFASEDSHYSVWKAARMYRMEAEIVDSNPDGTINIEALKKGLLRNRARGKPAIVNVNIGTTLKGGVDDLEGVVAALRGAGYADDEFFIHCDGALAGVMMSFFGGCEARYISFSRLPIGSVSVSGHKFIGSPVPCGVVLTRLEYIHTLSQNIDYINSRDATIMGSRNGHSPLYMWYALVGKGEEGIRKDVEMCRENAIYLEARLKGVGVEGVMLNRWSNTVVFRTPRDDIVKKWQLACKGDICHIVVMPNLSREKLDQFVAEYAKA